MGEPVERLYTVDAWEAEFRDQSPLNEYSPGEFFVGADDVITTSCTWANDTDSPLSHPQEMCVSLGMLYPATDAVMCASVD